MAAGKGPKKSATKSSGGKKVSGKKVANKASSDEGTASKSAGTTGFRKSAKAVPTEGPKDPPPQGPGTDV